MRVDGYAEISVSLIRRFEGFSALPYVCPGGYLTVGYGHAVRAGEDFSGGVTRETAEELLRADAEMAMRAVRRLVNAPLTPGQGEALASFTYNLGAGALQRSALRRKLGRGEYRSAADEFPRWVWAGGRRLPGLIARRAAERERFLEG